MKKQVLVLLTVLIFVLVSNIYSQTDKIPGWYLNPPQDDENIYALGEGSSLGLALMFALGELSDKLDTQVSNIQTAVDGDFQDNTSKTVTVKRFNNVKITQMIKNFAENDYSEHQVVAKMNYAVDNKSLEIRGFIKESGEASGDDLQIDYEFSDKGTGCDVRDVISDLEEVGISLRIFSSDKFYVMVKHPTVR